MYVQFATPMVAKSWPLIMVHGSGYTGSCVEGTAGGSEGWADYMVRNGVPTYVVDQSGRGRSGFDQSVIHEGEALIDTNTTAAKDLIPTMGGSTSTAWTSWFGHIVPTGTDITTGQMVRHGAPAIQSDGTPAPGQDPLCATEPAHCQQLGHIPMEPEAPWDLVAAIKAGGGTADYIQLDQPGPWQGSYAGPFGPAYVGPFAGISHMMMIESNPTPSGKAANLAVMDVILDWADKNISKPKTTPCPNSQSS
jgi:hypothetical protein